MRAHILVGALALAVGVAGPALSTKANAEAPKPREVIVHYADLARVMYEGAYLAAKDLQTKVDAFIAAPSAETFAAARAAWKTARDPYQETEGFRFGNPVIDDLEGNVNAWPLDEGLIDYVDKKFYGDSSDENPLYTANIIASEKIRIGKEEIDVTEITGDLLHKLNEAGGVESNVASGWHAVEFLLWGEDTHGTKAGAGERPYTDYDTKACTNGHCDRRAQYLKVATDTLVADIKEMADVWAADGAARAELLKKDDNGGLAVIFTGLGSLSYGELAGERMKLGLLLHDTEEEHDCFSDNTHNSHYYDEVSIRDIYYGRYEKADGTKVTGPSVADLVRATDPKVADEIDAKADAALAALKKIKDMGDSGQMTYDMMLAEGNEAGNKMVQDAVEALVAQAHAIERGVAVLKLQIEMEGSDSLDDPSAVAKK